MGWAINDTESGELSAGTARLDSISGLARFKKTGDARHFDPRVSALLLVLDQLDVKLGGADTLVFEDVKFASSQAQAHLWASFRGAVWAWAVSKAPRNIRISSLNTGTLKKFGTGHGNATKEMMAAALLRKLPAATVGPTADTVRMHSEILDDNAVDALHLLLWATK